VTPLLQAALDLQTFLDHRAWRHCIIGGIALLRWGEPRFTRDVDVTLLCEFGREDDVIAPLLDSEYAPRIPEAAMFARRNRVLLLQAPNGVGIDIALAGLPYEEAVVGNSSLFQFAPGCTLRTCSAEDLIVLKLFAFRPKDVIDAETVAARVGNALDWTYIDENLRQLAELKEEPEIMKALFNIRRRR
jgi:hypothetical protein